MHSKESFQQSTSIRRLDENLNRQLTLSHTQSDAFQGQVSTVARIANSVVELKSQNSHFQETAKDALADIQGRLHDLPKTAAVQFDLLKSSLEKIQSQIAELPSTMRDRSCASTSDPDEHPELSESLQRLSSLATEHVGKTPSAQAKGILDDLEVLLNHILQEMQSSARETRKKKRLRANDTDNTDNEDEFCDERILKKIKGLVCTSHRVEMNKKGLYYSKICLLIKMMT
jgi:hypothetical protein